MKIYLNSEELDYSLENEKTVLDIVNSIENWLKPSQMIIVQLKLDGKNITYNEIKDNNLSLQDVAEIEINASHIQEVNLFQILNLLQYFQELNTCIEKNDLSCLENKLKDFKIMCDELYGIFKVKSTSSNYPEINLLDKIFAGTTSGMIHSWTTENKKEASEALFQIIAKLTLLKNEIENPIATLTEVIQKLKIAKKNISEVSILLQTGKDREAMQAIVNFSEITQSLLRILSRVQLEKILNGITFKEKSYIQFYADFNKHLHELIEAFEKKDFVLLGDLLEYEIAPSVEEIIALSLKLKKQVEKDFL